MKSKIILSWPALKKRLQQERKRRKKIVFTNGCFDLLHVGHLKVFEFCRRHGSVLVVGLNSDRSVRRLKGPTRPLVPEQDRARLLAGFEAIDYVTLFPQDTPEKLIATLRPDILVKGGDWKKSQIAGRQYVKRVVRIPLVKGRSSTNLIGRVLDRYGKKKKKSAR